MHYEAKCLTHQDWEKISSTKKLNRFRPPEVTEAVRQLEMAKERLQAAAEEAYSDLLGGFAELYMDFRTAASALAGLDALQSLALVSGNEGWACRCLYFFESHASTRGGFWTGRMRSK